MNIQDNHINYVEFKSHNLETTKEFYTECFGWKFKNHGTSYISFSNGGLKGGFERSENNLVNGALIVIYHSDLEYIKDKVLKAGGKITKDSFTFPGGRRFQFEDPSGNELSVWSDN